MLMNTFHWITWINNYLSGHAPCPPVRRVSMLDCVWRVTQCSVRLRYPDLYLLNKPTRSA